MAIIAFSSGGLLVGQRTQLDTDTAVMKAEKANCAVRDGELLCKVCIAVGSGRECTYVEIDKNTFN